MSGKGKKGGPVTDIIWAIVFVSVMIGLLSKGNFSGVINNPLGWAKTKSDQLAECIGGKGCDNFIHLSGFEEKDINLPNLENKELPKLNKSNLPKFDSKNLPKFNKPNISEELEEPKMKELLGALTISDAEKVDYDRNEWKHWIPTENKCWNTREEVLYRDAVKAQLPHLIKTKKKQKIKVKLVI